MPGLLTKLSMNEMKHVQCLIMISSLHKTIYLSTIFYLVLEPKGGMWVSMAAGYLSHILSKEIINVHQL